MKEKVDDRIRATVRFLVELMVSGRFTEIEEFTQGNRLNADQIREAVASYGRELVMPPDAAFQSLEVVPIRNVSPEEYSIRFLLHTAEEGQSDLEIQATLIDSPASKLMGVEFDNLIVA